MHFGENQLSRSLIGLSPLSTARPLHFQLKWVRASTKSYLRFTLAMDRSPRFGSRTRHYNNALFGLALATATPHGLTSRHATDSQAHSSGGTPSPPTHSRRLRRIVCDRFQVLFHSPPGVLFTIPSRCSSTIGHQGVFRLSRWSCQIHTKFHEFRATWEGRQRVTDIRLREYHPLRSSFPTSSTSSIIYNSPARQQPDHIAPHNPHTATPVSYHTARVWPPPLSLATTHGITIVFSSYGY